MADRKDFFFRQKPTEAEIDEAFDDVEIADQRIVSDVVGQGFLVNHGPAPATVEENAVPDLNLRVNRFIGYDQLGRRLDNLLSAFKDTDTVSLGVSPQVLDMSTDEVNAGTAVAGGGNEKILSIFVQFNRNQFDPRLDGNGATVNFEQEESVALNVVQGAEAAAGSAVAPALRVDQLLLADVTLAFGQTVLLDADVDQTRREDFFLTGKIQIPPSLLGAGGQFRVQAQSPFSDKVEVQPGFLYQGSHAIVDANAVQVSGALGPVTASFERFDLVYLDSAGLVQVLTGTEQAAPVAAFDGAPGDALGPTLPDEAIPLAYVFVDETATVVIVPSDVTDLGGQHQLTRDNFGFLIDKGLKGGGAPAGVDDVVTGLFGGEITSTGSALGVVTSPPNNYVGLLDQFGDEIQHSTGARMFGRLTEAGAVWTLTYLFRDAAGAETSMDPAADTSGPAPTDVQLVAVRKVFSFNDPARPVFNSDTERLSDQLAGQIPDGDASGLKGKVEFAPDLNTDALKAVQGNDTRLASPIKADDLGGTPIGTRYDTLRENGGVSLTDLGGGELGISLPAGSLVSRTKVTRTANSAINNGIGTGGAVPQIGGATQLLTLDHTPSKIGNRFRLRSHTHVRSDITETVNTAIYATGRVVGPDAVGAGFAFTATTITRNDGGDWEDDGFRVGDLVTIANAEDAANDGVTGAITAITATLITIGTASFTVNADDTTVTFSPDTNALAADGNTSNSNNMRWEINSTGEGVFTSLSPLTCSLEAGGSGTSTAGGNGSRYGAAGLCWLEIEEFTV